MALQVLLYVVGKDAKVTVSSVSTRSKGRSSISCDRSRPERKLRHPSRPRSSSLCRGIPSGRAATHFLREITEVIGRARACWPRPCSRSTASIGRQTGRASAMPRPRGHGAQLVDPGRPGRRLRRRAAAAPRSDRGPCTRSRAYPQRRRDGAGSGEGQDCEFFVLSIA